ncbi:MAG TPA: hypothetical protein VIJ82_31510 [Streptosporangiaceae bacterium]|jgi:hypothetical protein
MRLDPEHLAHARQVADAILYEGYLLYPYRQSSQKNQVRFQFGVLMPPDYGQIDPHERSASQTECLLECPQDAQVRILVRFLQLQERVVQGISPETGQLHDVGALYVDGTEYTCWNEATEREQQVTVPVAALLREDKKLEFHIGPGETAEDLADAGGRPAGRLIRSWAALDGAIRISAERVAGPYQALRLRVRVENSSAPAEPLKNRDDGLRYALIAEHALIGVPGGTFLSMTDPPEWAAAAVAECENVGTWPVLAGPEDCRDLMLSSPVILYDHPEIAAESAGDLFDATEIDEILILRTLALTDAEKREARATDSRVAEMMDRLDDLPPEMLERMHGAIRYLRSAPAGARIGGGASAGGPGGSRPGAPMPGGPMPAASLPAAPMPEGSLTGEPMPGEPMAGMSAGVSRPGLAGALPGDPGVDWPGPQVTDRPAVPWWDPGSDSSVSPDTDHVVVDGVRIARDSRVIMRPGARRADAQDLFLIGREAVVEAVLHDVDGQIHLAVTPVDDPAADLQRNHGRFLYFAPDEVEPLGSGDLTQHEEEDKR